MSEEEWLTAEWKTFSGRLPAILHELLDQTAHQEGRSKAQTMARIIASYYRKHESNI